MHPYILHIYDRGHRTIHVRGDRTSFYLDFVVEKAINQMSVAVVVGGRAVTVTVTAAVRFSVVFVGVVCIAARQVTLETGKLAVERIRRITRHTIFLLKKYSVTT